MSIKVLDFDENKYAKKHHGMILVKKSRTIPGFSLKFRNFKDFQGLSRTLFKIQDFPGPVVTLLYSPNSGSFLWGNVELHFSINIWHLNRVVLLKAEKYRDKSRNDNQCVLRQNWNQEITRLSPKMIFNLLKITKNNKKVNF